MSSLLDQKALLLRQLTQQYNEESKKLISLRQQTEQQREKCCFLAAAKSKAMDEVLIEAVGKDLAVANSLLFG